MTATSRLLPVTGGAMISTFAIFYLMQALVAFDELDLPPPPDLWVLTDNIQDIKPPEVREIERLVEPLPPEPKPVDLPTRPPGGKNTEIFIGTQGLIPRQNTLGGDDLMIGFADGERIPIVRVQPKYPRIALERGIEGWVTVEFTVSEMGDVVDPVIIEAEPAGIFDRAALKAVARFKYKPTIVDGQARRSTARARLTFEIAGNE